MTDKKKPNPYIRPGLYPALRIKACKSLEPDERRRYRIYVIEFEIVKSEVVEHEVGQSVSWLMSATVSLQGFLASVLQIPFAAVTFTNIYEVFETDNPLQGLLLRCEAREQKTRMGCSFTHCKWTPIRQDDLHRI